jgi:hypothetical protein
MTVISLGEALWLPAEPDEVGERGRSASASNGKLLGPKVL